MIANTVAMVEGLEEEIASKAALALQSVYRGILARRVVEDADVASAPAEVVSRHGLDLLALHVAVVPRARKVDAREVHAPGGGRAHRLPELALDVDAPMRALAPVALGAEPARDDARGAVEGRHDRALARAWRGEGAGL